MLFFYNIHNKYNNENFEWKWVYIFTLKDHVCPDEFGKLYFTKYIEFMKGTLKTQFLWLQINSRSGFYKRNKYASIMFWQI